MGSVGGSVGSVVSSGMGEGLLADFFSGSFSTLMDWYSAAFRISASSTVSSTEDFEFSQQIRAFSGLLPSKSEFSEISNFSFSTVPRSTSSSSSSLGWGITMGCMALISRSCFWASSSCSFSFSTASRFRSTARSERVVSKVMRISPFFTSCPIWTSTSVTVCVVVRYTV